MYVYDNYDQAIVDTRVEEFRDQTSLIVSPDKILDICQSLHDEHGFTWLEVLTAVDYWPEQEPRFHVIYFLYSIEKSMRIGLRVPLPGVSPAVRQRKLARTRTLGHVRN